MNATAELIAQRYMPRGATLHVEPVSGGLVHDSWLAQWQQSDRVERALLQRINNHVFRDPAALMENVQRVSGHLGEVIRRGAGGRQHRVLRLLPMNSGAWWATADDGSAWRAFEWIAGAQSIEVVDRPEQAYAAARAFGDFQRMLLDLPGPRLHEVLPDFHDTPRRLAALDRAIEAAAPERLRAADRELARVAAYRESAAVLVELQRAGHVPERVAHYDAKPSNVLFDQLTGDALCVIDFDTVMPGLWLYDFGDLVRSMTCRAAEDERDAERVEVDVELYSAVVHGYLDAVGALLAPAERAHLVTASELITYEQGVRFLTDYLRGDRYYRTQRPGHNLERCRVQLALLRSLQDHAAVLTQIVRSAGG